MEKRQRWGARYSQTQGVAPTDEVVMEEPSCSSCTADRKVRVTETTFWPLQPVPIVAKTGNEGRDMAKRCGSHGLIAAITSKKTEQCTHKPIAPCLHYGPQHLWWKLKEIVEMPLLAQSGWQPLFTRRQHQELTGLEPITHTSHHVADTLRPRRPVHRRDTHPLREDEAFSKTEGTAP